MELLFWIEIYYYYLFSRVCVCFFLITGVTDFAHNKYIYANDFEKKTSLCVLIELKPGIQLLREKKLYGDKIYAQERNP